MFKIFIKIQGIDQEFTLTGKDFKCITTENEYEANRCFNKERNALLKYCNPDYNGCVTLYMIESSSGIIMTSFVNSICFSLTQRLILTLKQSKIIND